MSPKTNIYVSKHFRTIAVMTLISSIMWTAVSLYGAMTKDSASSLQRDLLKPISPTLDSETLSAIAQKRQLTNELKDQTLLQSTIVVTSPTPSPSSRVSQQAATINEVEIASTVESTSSASPSADAIHTETAL